MTADLLLRAVRVAGPSRELMPTDEPVDILIRRGIIADIGPAGNLRAAVETLDGEGAWVIPGLWDHHVHTVQWALDAQRIPLGGASGPAEAAALAAGAAPLPDGRIVGAGFRDALWHEGPTLALLDAATGERPVYLINADVHSVWLNSAALRREGFEGADDDGLLREEDAFEISRRLNATDTATVDAAVSAAGAAAAARGVTGLVDFDMAWNAEAWRRRTDAGFDLHRVEFVFYPDQLERAIAEGLHSGDELPGTGGMVRVGPLKLISDGSLGTRTAACSHAYAGEPGNRGALNIDPVQLRELLMRSTASGIDAAVHAIGDRAVTAALDAFAFAQARGTIEHAQLVRHADLAKFARLGIAASVQPAHAVDDRDLADELWRDQQAIAYPLASLVAAGASLRFGSDAPVAALDPWQTIAAAVFRTGDDREPWHPEERVPIDVALQASSRHGAASIGLGETADLVLCAADPQTADRETLSRMPVPATILGGRITHRA
ncbi:amidohydrolase family protein [Microbacterium sp. ARD32]|uniref:amidohydrolase n=1 Tax=Microbacterium sp. ARD32 TaxID=2962577 RepID=UPI002881064E|nr:amidohydrolase family protein [Microbacterium sp. ARD32]MDT0157327.1 amidohydrolase family protein [Microbacterium sp. ARD32]